MCSSALPPMTGSKMHVPTEILGNHFLRIRDAFVRIGSNGGQPVGSARALSLSLFSRSFSRSLFRSLSISASLESEVQLTTRTTRMIFGQGSLHAMILAAFVSSRPLTTICHYQRRSG